jgi:hypothetical protein
LFLRKTPFFDQYGEILLKIVIITSTPGANLPTTFKFTYNYNASIVCIRLELFYIGSKKKNLKTRQAISCVANFYNAGVVTRDHRIGP